jgi:hypothetical protein
LEAITRRLFGVVLCVKINAARLCTPTLLAADGGRAPVPRVIVKLLKLVDQRLGSLNFLASRVIQ